MTKVVNLYKTSYDVYIGRPRKGESGIWQNPYPINESKGDTRKKVIEKHLEYTIERLMSGDLLVSELMELDGKTLGCFCAPKMCHGHNYVSLIDFIKENNITTNEEYRQVMTTGKKIAKRAPVVIEHEGVSVLIFGSRIIPDDRKEPLVAEAVEIAKGYGATQIVHGGARGADILGEDINHSLGTGKECVVYKPEWYDKNGNYVRSAGFQRNSTLVARSDKAIGLWDGFSRGTQDTIRKLMEAGKPFKILNYTEPTLDFKKYIKKDVISFKYTRDKFGFLSNFNPYFLVRYGSFSIASELMYQQFKLMEGFKYLTECDGLSVKDTKNLMYSIVNAINDSRGRFTEYTLNPDFFKYRELYMLYTIRLKYRFHEEKFKHLKNKIIVEDTHDLFWGAYLHKGVYQGYNRLGELWIKVINEHHVPIKEVKGDMFPVIKEHPFALIHGVNNQNAWGAGFVLSINKHYPQVKSKYHDWMKQPRKLGDVLVVQVSETQYVCNIVTQEKLYSPKPLEDDRYTTKPPFSMDALVSGLITVSNHDDLKHLPKVMPRIGSGLAGGDWRLIKPIIDGLLNNVCVYRI